ncbi:MAG TPA: adenylate/guanylate cyclase domain-containing protein [Thermohalobaculum sp.]|nr:adenylate/guanylate cyclase domain-containing protein [Thermohalobaculum sp.]
MTDNKIIRKLTTIVAADFVGYSRLMEIDEVGTLTRLKAYRSELIDPSVAHHGGRTVKTTGDGFLFEFSSVVSALESAIQIQTSMARLNADTPEDQQMLMRIGVTIGDVIIEGDDIYGDGVNIAARLEGVAQPGGISVSMPVRDQIQDKLSVSFKDLGDVDVKNLNRPIHVFQVLMGDETLQVINRRRRKGVIPVWLQAAAVVLVAVVAVAGTYFLTDRSGTSPPPMISADGRITVGVLPFDNMSGDKEQEYFSDGLSEDLITDLSKVLGIQVASRNATFAYKGTAAKFQQIVQELGLRYVVEGSVRREGSQLRVNAQLIDGLTGLHVWADRYDRSADDVFAVQDEIVTAIIDALKIKLSPVEESKLGRNLTDSPEAYDEFLLGRSFRGGTSPQTNIQASNALTAATLLDPRFAAAHAELSWVHFLAWYTGWNGEPEELQRALRAAEKAVELDPELSLAHGNLGWVYLWLGRHEEALAAARKAVELDPNSIDALLFLGDVLNFYGKPEEAIEVTERGMELDPALMYHLLEHLAHSKYLMGDVEGSLRDLKRSSKLYPDYLITHLILASIYGNTGDKIEASAEIQKILQLNPGYNLAAQELRAPYKDPATRKAFMEGLKAAGAPE